MVIVGHARLIYKTPKSIVTVSTSTTTSQIDIEVSSLIKFIWIEAFSEIPTTLLFRSCFNIQLFFVGSLTFRRLSFIKTFLSISRNLTFIPASIPVYIPLKTSFASSIQTGTIIFFGLRSSDTTVPKTIRNILIAG